MNNVRTTGQEMSRTRVLFVCNSHGARSRIAERFAREDASDLIEPSSAAFEPLPITRGLPLNAMAEFGMAFPSEPVALVFDLHRAGATYDYVVTICEEATAITCPEFQRAVSAMFKRKAVRVAWAVQDFKTLEGSAEEKLAASVAIRDRIRDLVGRLSIHIAAHRASASEAVDEH